jgi:hypothetical protein
VEYTKINIIAFQNEETVLEATSIAIGSNVAEEASTLLEHRLLQL